MTQEKFIDIVSGLLAALVVAALVALAGGPKWAMFGFGLMTYYMFRLRDVAK